MRLSFVGIVILSFVAVSGIQHASQVRSKPFPYTRTVWRVGSGLPEDTVQAISQSSDGPLWLGTTGGLAFFDGAHMQSYEVASASVSSNSFFSLTLDHTGTLWAGTEGGGLIYVDARGNPHEFAASAGLSDGFVRSIYEDTSNRLWVGTDGGLFLKQGERFQRWGLGNVSSTPLAVHSITEGRDHRLWVGGSRLFSIDSDGHEDDYSLPGPYSQNRVKCIRQTSDGTVWVGTVGGLDRLRNGHFENVAGITSTVRSILQSSDGTLWIGTIGSGLWQIRDGKPIHVSEAGLLPSETVLAIFEDGQHQIWIGTQAGLVRLNKTAVNLIPLPEAGDPDFETISGDDHGVIWVAAQKLYLLHDGGVQVMDPLPHEPISVRNIFRAREGNLWVGTDGNGVYEVTPEGTTRHFSAPAQLTNNFIRGFLQTRNGSLWVACDEGVNILTAGSWKKLTEADGLAYFSIRSLLESRDGSVWIGTDRGLSHWAHGHFLHDDATAALATEKVWSVLEDNSGSVWFGTRDHGLFGLTSGGLVHETTATGLPANSVFQLLEDRKHHVWISGPNSIASIEERDLNAPGVSPLHPLRVRVYSMPFGGDGGQLYGGRQPSGYLSPDDSVWFPTTRGVAHIGEAEVADVQPPRATLGGVTLDGRSVAVRDGKLSVPSHISRIAFDFSALFLRPQEELRFRYQLEPFDHGWTMASSNRTATYTNLPGRSYRFRVIAYDLAQPEKLSEVDLEIIKAPFFYQTWWFYTLSALALAGLVWSVYQIRLRQVRQRFAAVMEERSRLAREMHDTVVQGCVGISTLLEAVVVIPSQDAVTRNELLSLAREQARSTVSQAREVVWDMRHEDESEVDLVAALHSLAGESGPGVVFATSLSQLSTRASASHELLMMVREAVNNALQHSGTNEVSVGADIDRGNLILIVADCGQGFDADVKRDLERHYGILGMRERIERLKGALVVQSFIGTGTSIVATVPLRAFRNTVARTHHA